ncbi:hypothetical protein, partial [Mycobacterium sp.]|uniref:hypothetical protein n=1 Tax=Mycobacterium sp. TaxID=1785 RepID=UPI002BA06061
MTFDDVPTYGRERIAAVLDRVLERGVAEDVVNEGKELAESARYPQVIPRNAHFDWNQYGDPEVLLAKLNEEAHSTYVERKRRFSDWFTETFTAQVP